jgi:hypothetical protein
MLSSGPRSVTQHKLATRYLAQTLHTCQSHYLIF